LIKSLNGTKDRAVGVAMGAAHVGMEEATTKMKSAASTVGDAYHNLPSIITDGIIANTDDDEIVNSLGVQIKDIDSDIQDFERATTASEESDLLAAKAIHGEIKELPAKVDVGQEMFLGKWSLETAISHIKEMSSLVSLSKLMETLADQIHKLIKAITTLLRVMPDKIQSVAEQLQTNGLDSVVDAAGDLVSDEISSMMGKVFGGTD
jgi:hypothetical protein